jgi:hypothetical protein
LKKMKKPRKASAATTKKTKSPRINRGDFKIRRAA